MIISQDTQSFVSALQRFSHEQIQHPDDLASLIELARIHHLAGVLDDLSFLAKFLVKTSGVMNRVGPGEEGFDKLSREFSTNLEKASTYLRTLVKEAPEDVKHHFTTTYFAMTADALTARMQLLRDVNWLKNWKIDRGTAM